MYYVYVLKTDSAKRPLYIGYTQDLKRRFVEHNHDYKAELIYYESYQTEELARQREAKLKQYGSAWRGLKKRLGL